MGISFDSERFRTTRLPCDVSESDGELVAFGSIFSYGGESLSWPPPAARDNSCVLESDVLGLTLALQGMGSRRARLGKGTVCCETTGITPPPCATTVASSGEGSGSCSSSSRLRPGSPCTCRSGRSPSTGIGRRAPAAGQPGRNAHGGRTTRPGVAADPARVSQTQADLARVRPLAAEVVRAAGVPMTAVELLRSSSVTTKTNSDILTFSVESEDPALATRLATAYARGYTNFRRRLDTSAIERARSEAQARLERARGRRVKRGRRSTRASTRRSSS